MIFGIYITMVWITSSFSCQKLHITNRDWARKVCKHVILILLAIFRIVNCPRLKIYKLIIFIKMDWNVLITRSQNLISWSLDLVTTWSRDHKKVPIMTSPLPCYPLPLLGTHCFAMWWRHFRGHKCYPLWRHRCYSTHYDATVARQPRGC